MMLLLLLMMMMIMMLMTTVTGTSRRVGRRASCWRIGRRRRHPSRYQTSLPSSHVDGRRRTIFCHRDAVGRRTRRYEQPACDVAVGGKDKVQVRIRRFQVDEGHHQGGAGSFDARQPRRLAARTLRESV